MTQKIHPTAVIDPAAQLAEGVEVGPYSIIGPHVVLGEGCRIGAHVVIEGKTTMGAGNRVFHHSVLGQEPQDLKFKGEDVELVIGDNNVFREHVTIHLGTANGGGKTSVGNNNLLMVGAHVAHDSHVGNHVILANNVLMAGHITIQDFAVVSGGTAIHHFVTVGKYAFVGGLSGLVRDAPPFMVTDGNHAFVRGVNAIGLGRNGFSSEEVDQLKSAYRLLFLRTVAKTQSEGLAELRDKAADQKLVMELCDFVERSASGIHGRYAESLRQDDRRSGPTA